MAALIASSLPAAAQAPVINGVISQATFATPVAPGMPVVVNGTNLADASAAVCPGPQVPLVCGGVSVTVNGRAVPVRLAYQSQLVTYIPAEQPAGPVSMVVKNHRGMDSAPFVVTVETTAPGIQRLGDASGSTLGFFSDSARRVIGRANPAPPGQEFTVYAVGLGPTNPPVATGETGTAPLVTLPMVWVGSRAAPVIAGGLGCGVLCEPGVYLVRFLLPPDTTPGDQPVSVEISGKRSPPATLVVGAGTAGPAAGYLQSVIDSRARMMSPGMIANVVGGGFTVATAGGGPCSLDGTVWPLTCQGVTVTINGRRAAIQTVTPNFITIQIPFEAAPGPATLVVERLAGSQTLRSDPLAFTLETLSPTLPADPTSSYAGVVIQNSGGPASVTNPLLPDDTIILFPQGLGQTNPPMVTGFGLLQPAPTVLQPSVTVGGKALENVVAEVLPGTIGQYRVTASVPKGIASGDQPIVLEVGGKKSQAGLRVPVSNDPVIAAVTNAASSARDIVSGSWVSIYGRNLSVSRREWTESDFLNGWLPTDIEGVNVTIGGIPAVVAFVSPLQLNVLAPDGLPPGPAEVIVQSPAGWQKSLANVKPYAPGIFGLPVPPGTYLSALHTDWSYVARPGQLATNVTARPARPGETIIFYGTGFGPTDPPVSAYHRFSGSAPLAGTVPVRVQIGGAEAEVTYAGLVANGLYQMNVVVPEVADGDREVVVTMGTEASPRGRYIPVQR